MNGARRRAALRPGGGDEPALVAERVGALQVLVMQQVGTEVVPEHRCDGAPDVLLREHIAEPVEVSV
jgi:hypothetical protein